METKVTRVFDIDPNSIDFDKIKIGGDILKNGGTVAFPTETVYGLGANALDEGAISKIFEAKGRPQDNPLIVHISDIEEIYPLVREVPVEARRLMDKFWPGPLTIIFEKSQKIPLKITGGLNTVAIRMPSHSIARALIKSADMPIAAPSANTSGKPSPTTAEHVIADLMGKIDMVIDGGPTGVGLESTVLDLSAGIPTILRPGGITKEDILTIFPKVNVDPAIIQKDDKLIPKSPGQKYKHYAPKAKMKIVQGDIYKVSHKINQLVTEYVDKGLSVGIMATTETKDRYKEGNIIVVGNRKCPETIATNLFKVLRDFDMLNVDIILAEGIEENGIGMAIMNRMNKASGGDIMYI
ncbi:L-threonylcarbamoyladenylate synthase [Clostridiisalibacter paucivorans]|uniref:L-threonylcarbamoyladenylate synthase n=1 Tax=Clostridiisalibacter paucivorans TaxID=408753 RepID=UPI000552845B|nr:L-threonylcarbamoyladenylate synthase [Clostridiisalibacter paucivorans]